ncbi:MAG: peptidylprolyl isomerase [Chloroflexota bacterium]|nr:peptidylprolyl isomerase [Chloroflexota bacterium]
MKRFLIAAALISGTLLAASAAFAQTAQTPDEICAAAPTAEPATRTYTGSESVLETGVDYRAIFCTESGAVYIDLLEDYAPLTVNNFVFLAENGYYNNTTFHRVLQDFMAQAGDPEGTGAGGPGYQFQDEFVPFLTFDAPGVLAMANAGANTNGSQFFITTAPTPHLNQRHTIFGVVLAGQENVLSLRLRDPQTNPTEPGAALSTVVIVTDPTTVSAETTAPTTATSEEAQTIYDIIAAEIAQPEVAAILSLDATQSGVFDAETLAAAAPESIREAYAAFLAANGFEGRTAVSIQNSSCDLESAPYMQITYSLDAFPSAVEAGAALADGTLGELATARGFIAAEPVETLRYPLYTQTTTACERDATHGLTFWQRGRYVVTIEALFPSDSPATADLWLARFVGPIMETYFGAVLVKEVR